MNILFKERKDWRYVEFISEELSFETNLNNEILKKYPKLKFSTINVLEVVSSEFNRFIVFFDVLKGSFFAKNVKELLDFYHYKWLYAGNPIHWNQWEKVLDIKYLDGFLNRVLTEEESYDLIVYFKKVFDENLKRDVDFI